MMDCKVHGTIIPFHDSTTDEIYCPMCNIEKEKNNPHHWEECNYELQACSICQGLLLEEIA